MDRGVIEAFEASVPQEWIWAPAGNLTLVRSQSDEELFQLIERLGHPIRGSAGVVESFLRRADPNAPFGPTFEQALREELGPRLEKGKGEIEILVIDHMEKPSEN